MTSDALLDEYIETGTVSVSSISKGILNREVIPVLSGCALKNEGVQKLLEVLKTYIINKDYPDSFKGIVYKIKYDQRERLTFMKVTGGSIKVKDVLENGEKINSIRFYNGGKYKNREIAYSGDVVALTGINNLEVDDVLGEEKKPRSKQLEPYLNYHIQINNNTMIDHLKQLSQEYPELNLKINKNDATVSLMGEIQIDVLKNIIKDRYNEEVTFSQGEVAFKETILETVEGVGHYEPLRHYGEVHLLMEPLKEGSGLVIDSQCSEDVLALHWQRLIMTHISERVHPGVLIGAPITDMKITLINGRAHLKHTQGGDFRQATYRAIRQGLKMTRCALLEPYYSYHLEIPSEYLSKAIYHIEQMNGTYSISQDNEMTLLEGIAPIRKMQNYQLEVISYTKGRGKLIVNFEGYHRSKDEASIIEDYHYDSENDLDHPTGSIFCSHGAGYFVPYDKVYEHMHIPLSLKKERNYKNNNIRISNEELDEIFIRTYGPIRNRGFEARYEKKEVKAEEHIQEKKKECLIVDGYNVIFTSELLHEISKNDLSGARDRLIDALSNYQGYKQCLLILVFDAYKVKGNIGSVEKNHNIYVVYTKEAQSADAYIERTTRELAKDYRITVATSDALEQVIIMGAGATRISSRQLLLEMASINQENYESYASEDDRNYLLDNLNKLK